MKIRSVAVALAMCLPLAACGSDGGDGGGGDEPDAGPTSLLDPPPAGQGVQFVMTTTLGAGVEAEHCMLVKGPAEAMWVNRDEVRFTAGSHHFLLYETDYTDIPTQKDDGTPVDTSGVFDCSDGPTSGWSIRRLVGGSQNGTGDSVVAFPETVALKVEANKVFLMNAHYVNASDQPLEPEVRINLWTIPETAVTEEGDILFLYNPLLRSQANSTNKGRWQCPVYGDITLSNVQSHMHERGVGFSASVMGDAPFYTNTAWADVPVKQFAPGLQIADGAKLDYTCDYENVTDTGVYQGPRSTDEMCMLIGSYYPADPRTSGCLTPEGGQFGGDFVGEGTATCDATLNCLLASFQNDGGLPGITDCMLDADPAVAEHTSALLRCFANADNPQTDCGTQISTCQAN